MQAAILSAESDLSFLQQELEAKEVLTSLQEQINAMGTHSNNSVARFRQK